MLIKEACKIVLIPLGLTAAASETDAAIQRNIFWWGMTPLIISNEEMSDFMKIVASLEGAGLLIKVVVKQWKMKQNNKTVCYYGMLLCTLGASLLGNLKE